jgi:hypothetical protein
MAQKSVSHHHKFEVVPESSPTSGSESHSTSAPVRPPSTNLADPPKSEIKNSAIARVDAAATASMCIRFQADQTVREKEQL